MPDKFRGIYYQCFGDPAKPAVLFLHGFLGNSSDWQHIVDMISNKCFCISLDLPGHGHSNKPDFPAHVWNFKSLSEIISDLLSHLALEKISLVGYSMGGRIAQHFVVNFSDKVTKLVLESTSPGILNKEERAARLQADEELALELKKESFSEFVDAWYDQSLFQGIKEFSKFENMLKKRLSNDPGLMAKALIAFSTGRQSFLGKELSLLKMPVLLICGEKDDKYLKIMKELKEENPGFRISIINACGHNTHFEKPNLFAEHLIEFLSL